jgi:hypothetical protein
MAVSGLVAEEAVQAFVAGCVVEIVGDSAEVGARHGGLTFGRRQSPPCSTFVPHRVGDWE